MRRWFTRSPEPDTSALGSAALAQTLARGALVPAGCVGVVCDKGGPVRRVSSGSRADCGEHEWALCFHPGPYSADLLPFASAPELGLRLTFGIDSADPRLARQRFDLYLASEAPDGVALASFCALLDATLQRELAQGNLELPPCTTAAEWEAFRAALNELLYTRFGISVADCLPVDLGESVDYAQLLLARATPAGQAPGAVPVRQLAPPDDAQALRRLFLELPTVTSALRLVNLPPGQVLFRLHQALLQRLANVSLSVSTMPALSLAAPGVILDSASVQQRARHSVQALAALDEAWALLARARIAPAVDLDAVFDEADRIVANLELACAARRATP
jgi:hypothetical protein